MNPRTSAPDECQHDGNDDVAEMGEVTAVVTQPADETGQSVGIETKECGVGYNPKSVTNKAMIGPIHARRALRPKNLRAVGVGIEAKSAVIAGSLGKSSVYSLIQPKQLTYEFQTFDGHALFSAWNSASQIKEK